MTNECVRTNHQIIMDNNMNANCKINELIDALGGLDIVFQIYLSNKTPSPLTKDQLFQINNALISINNDLYPILTVSATNTFLHQIIAVIFSKVMTIIVSILLFLWILSFFPIFGIIFMYKLYFWSFIVIFTPYIILTVLSLNIITTKQIMKTFEFWFKSINFIRFWISIWIFMCIKISFRYKSCVLASGALYISMVAFRYTKQ